MAEFIGGSLDQDVIKQLELRSKFLSGKTPSQRETLVKEQLFSTAFVNVISSVNVTDQSRPEETGSKLAENHVLSGGLYRWDGKKFIKREGFNFLGNDFESAYRFTDAYGVRPIPGITSFSIQSKGTYGTIRDATVGFSVYSLEDLEKMEKLYLRPGFTVVVEWGHTAYLINNKDNNGEPLLTTNLSSILAKNKDVFSEKKISDIEDSLRGLKETTQYNYDSFIGYIKNFSYKFNKEGGYDCTLSIISKGEILDSLTTNTDEGPVSTYTDDTNSITPFSSQTNFLTKFVGSFPRTLFGDFGGSKDGKELKITKEVIEKNLNRIEFSDKIIRLATLRFIPVLYSFFDFKNERNEIENFVRYAINQRGGKDYLGFAKSIEYTESDTIMPSKFSTVYFPLDVVLSLFNYFIKEKINNQQAPLFHVNQTPRYFRYNSFKNHVSLKPKVGVLPKRPEDPCWSDLYILRSPTEKPAFMKDVRGTIGPSVNDLISDDLLDIRNIHVSNLYLDEIFKNYTDSSLVEKNNFKEMLKTILDDLSEALGGVNEFDIEYDDDKNYFFIVDRTVPGIEGDNGDGTDIPVLPLAGLAGITTDITLESKITKDLANKISIAAQSTESGFNEYVSNYRKWREGIVDRFIAAAEKGKTDKEIREEQARQQESAQKKLEERKKSTKKLFESLKDSYYNLRIDGHLYDSDWESFPGMASSLFKRYVELDTTANGKPPKGVIPLELSFTIKGISGVKIGQSFKIQKGLLPAKYTDEYGFIVTGIDNTISGGTWLTTVKAYTYILSKPEQKDIQRAKEELTQMFECTETESRPVITTSTDFITLARERGGGGFQ